MDLERLNMTKTFYFNSYSFYFFNNMNEVKDLEY